MWIDLMVDETSVHKREREITELIDCEFVLPSPCEVQERFNGGPEFRKRCASQALYGAQRNNVGFTPLQVEHQDEPDDFRLTLEFSRDRPEHLVESLQRRAFDVLPIWY
ncbi:MAG TPA: hypothetical protein VMD75_17300 [Candidatus Binataceae bacterium]|nr:hypothetical protein [Candidatus Binataceae bacterium]